MKMKKILASLLAVTLTLPQLADMMPSTLFVQTSAAEATASSGWFYDQLPTEAQVFYQAIQEMHDSGILKTGSDDFDLTGKYLTQEQAAAYAEGGAGVLDLFGAARDAFYMEHTDIFYVDISSLSIRVTYDSESYHVYIGTGRRDSYYADGYSSTEQVNTLLDNYNAAIETIAQGAEGMTAAEQVEYVHDYLTHHTSYRLENACKTENLGFIRTAYGALVSGEAVCEGYARAFKAVMDRLGIPCVLVNGVYRHDADALELHMWAEVEIDGTWYGVDVTMDDPKSPASDNGVDGYESHEYLLVGSTSMDVHHAVSGIISEANYEFFYPELPLYGYGVKTAYNNDDLTVRYTQDAELDGEQVDAFYVSYKGMGIAKAREQGYYFLNKMDDTGWMYIIPEYYPALVDTDTELQMPLPGQIDHVQFSITDIPYEIMDYEGVEIIDQMFYGDPELLPAVSEEYHNSHGGYVPPPYPTTVTPSMTSKVYTNNGTYHVSITYNDKLAAVDGEEPGVILESTGPTALANTTITNFEWDNESTVTFDFSPSKMFADNNAFYYVTLSGLVGEKSQKTPYQVTYLVGGMSSFCCCRANGFNWNVFGQPALIDNTDISTNDWKMADGEGVDELLKHRMVLVASSTTDEQADAMNSLMEETSSSKILKSETYNINLTVCNQMVISTGQGVRVSLGFPEGYGPDDAGVTFKAYHFIKNDAGEVTGVEEIPCIITQYGLIIECKSFSPFAVVAVEDDGSDVTTRSFVTVATTGGTVSGADSIISLQEGETASLTIQADEQYEIESISVDGKAIEVTDSSKMELTVAYADFAKASGIVDIKFIAKSVIEKEASRNETAIQIDAEQPAVPETTTPETTTEAPETTTEAAPETTTEPAPQTTTAPAETTTAAAAATETTTTATTTIETTTETTAKPTEETTSTETSGGSEDADLPQTGNHAPAAAAATAGALALMLTGAFAMLRSGVLRKKEE